MTKLKQILLFLISPFIALGYMAAFPGVAVKMLLSGDMGKAE